MSSPLTTSIPLSEPTVEAGRRFDFDHIPQLGPYKEGDKRSSLLPKEGGRPGLTYAQVPVKYVRQAEASGWLPMFENYRYTIIGPNGFIDMELMAMGALIEGLSPSAIKNICLKPFLRKEDGTQIDLICEATGLSPATGFPCELKLPYPSTEAATDAEAQTQVEVSKTDPVLQVGSESVEIEQQNSQGETSRPEPDEPTGSRKGRRHTQRS